MENGIGKSNTHGRLCSCSECYVINPGLPAGYAERLASMSTESLPAPSYHLSVSGAVGARDEHYDTIETPAWWSSLCDLAARAYSWFHRLVWCRRNKHVWVDTETCVFLESKYTQVFLFVAECEHCDACRWVKLDDPPLVVAQYANYDAAMKWGKDRRFTLRAEGAYEVHA